MSFFYRLPLLGIALLTAVALTGCESKSKREFNAGCQSGGTDRSTCSCVYDQLGPVCMIIKTCAMVQSLWLTHVVRLSTSVKSVSAQPMVHMLIELVELRNIDYLKPILQATYKSSRMI